MSATPAEEGKTIDRDELSAKLERGDPFRLVMSLNEWAYRARHIPGSEHFNTPQDLLTSLRTDEDCHARVAMYWALLDAGYTNARRYAGGLTDWESAGPPLVGDWARDRAEIVSRAATLGSTATAMRRGLVFLFHYGGAWTRSPW